MGKSVLKLAYLAQFVHLEHSSLIVNKLTWFFSGNPLVDDRNIQNTKKFKLQLDASVRNFVSQFFGSVPE